MKGVQARRTKLETVVDAETQRDEELLTLSGDQAEHFVAFYDRALPGLLGFFVRRTFDAQIAADLSAETLADAFASRSRFRDRGDGSASAWLYSIARRKLSHFLRRRRVDDTARRRLGLEHVELGPDDIDRVEELIDFEQVGRAVGSAFDELRPDQREALRLRVIEGRSYAEIASALGCSEDVVRARVSRGLNRLALQLDG
jgi:RNA polymerase sigma factor (sigma-70 family)